MNIENLYKENEAMIHKLAFRNAMDRQDYEENVSKANLIFMECTTRFEGRCKFSSYLYKSLETGLKGKASPEIIELTEIDEPLYFEDKLFLSDLNLSEDAWAVVTEILEAPVKLISSEKNKITKEALKKHIKKTKGWSISYILRLYDEISGKLEEVIQ